MVARIDLGGENLTWYEVEPGRWERGIDEAEQYYSTLSKLYEGTGRTYYCLTGHVSISSTAPSHVTDIEWRKRIDDALRKAWVSLRCFHPAIASYVEWNTEYGRFVKIFNTINGYQPLQSLEVWLSRTFHLVSGFSSGRQWCNSDPPAPQLSSLFVIEPEVAAPHNTRREIRRDLVLRVPHDITDGIGLLQLTQCLLTHVSQALRFGQSYRSPGFVNERERLSPPLRIALKLPAAPSQETLLMSEDVLGEEECKIQHNERLAIPLTKATTLPARSQRVDISLSSSKTSRILAACKGAEVTVTHAYHAAIVVGLSRLQHRRTHSRLMQYVDYGFVDLRGMCPRANSGTSHAAAVYHSPLPRRLIVDVTIPAQSDGSTNKVLYSTAEFLRVLALVKSFYMETRECSNLAQLAPLCWKAYTPYLPSDLLQPRPIHSLDQTPSVWLSSMGVFDNLVKCELGLLEAHDLWVGADELGTGLGMLLGSFRSQLNLSAIFNEAWHNSEEVLTFLHECDSIVTQGFGIDEQTIPAPVGHSS